MKKAASAPVDADGKKKRRKVRKETYSSYYIYKGKFFVHNVLSF